MHERTCCIDVASTFTGHGKAGLHDIVFAWPTEDKTVLTDRLHELLVRTALRSAKPRLHLILLAATSYTLFEKPAESVRLLLISCHEAVCVGLALACDIVSSQRKPHSPC